MNFKTKIEEALKVERGFLKILARDVVRQTGVAFTVVDDSDDFPEWQAVAQLNPRRVFFMPKNEYGVGLFLKNGIIEAVDYAEYKYEDDVLKVELHNPNMMDKLVAFVIKAYEGWAGE